MEFHIENMTCGGCIKGVTKAIQSVDPDAKIDASLETKLVQVTSTRQRNTFLPALERAGFPVA